MSHLSKITPTPQQEAARAPDFASILIVDDEDFDRARLRKICEAFDFTTHVAEAGSLVSMRDRLRKDRFDLILLDYHLTDGTGLDGVEAIRADPVNANAATIMITGSEQSDIAVQALKLGFSDYLTKDEISDASLKRATITALQKSQLAHGLALQATKRHAMSKTLQSFSRECAQDIKPVVSRMMRQMRELRDIDQLEPHEASERVEAVEGSLRRLWAFLDELDRLSGHATGPSVSPLHGGDPVHPKSSDIRTPSERPVKTAAKTVRPPSIFRRRPD